MPRRLLPLALFALTSCRPPLPPADLVVRSKDVFALPQMEIAEAEPLLTVAGGRVTYRREE